MGGTWLISVLVTDDRERYVRWARGTPRDCLIELEMGVRARWQKVDFQHRMRSSRLFKQFISREKKHFDGRAWTGADRDGLSIRSFAPLLWAFPRPDISGSRHHCNDLEGSTSRYLSFLLDNDFVVVYPQDSSSRPNRRIEHSSGWYARSSIERTENLSLRPLELTLKKPLHPSHVRTP